MNNNFYKLTIDIAKANQIMAEYRGYSAELTNPYMLFRAKLDGCTITIFKTLTVTFQGRLSLDEYNRWAKNKIVSPLDETKVSKPKSVPSQSGYTISHIGSDEVGTGDYFGPMVVVASFVRNSQIEQLKQLGVKDSKLLSDDKIKAIASQLITLIPYVALMLSPEKINAQSSRNDNFNYLKAVLHNHAILKLQSQIPDYLNYPALIDQFCSKELFYQYLNNETTASNLVFEEKAESLSFAVASSSIIARYIFLTQLEKMNKDYDMTFLKGASNAVDKVGKEFIKRYGKDQLTKVAKLKFTNTERILND